jgi:fluoride exporter
MTAIGWTAFLIAAGFGATARYLLSLAIQDRVAANRPWGTFVVNVSGCLAAGLVAGFVIHHGLGPTSARVMAVGFLGSFTTFSTLTYETVRLAEVGELRVAAVNLGGSLVIGVAAATAGLTLAATIGGG